MIEQEKRTTLEVKLPKGSNRTVTFNMDQNQGNVLFFYGILFMVMALIIPFMVMNISVSTTPLAKQFYGYDMQVFITQGMFWAKGLIPYKDAFDHKGPLTFLIYAVGWKLNPENGIFVLQCIALWISSVFSYLICKQFISNKYIALIGILSFWGYFALVIDEGGLCEEFNLPILMISTYLITHFLCSKKDEHPPQYAFVYGATIAMSFCFRATNCISVCGAVFVIAILLIKGHHYKNLVLNIVGFLLGFGLFFTPFFVYFAIHGALSDFIWGTFLYNFLYASEGVHHNIDEWKTILLYLIPIGGSVFLAVWEQKRIQCTVIFSAILTGIMLIRCYLFPHYYIIVSLFVPIVIGLLFRRGGNFTCDNWMCRTQIIGICTIMVICSFISLKSFENIYGKANWIQYLRTSSDGIIYKERVCDQISVIPVEDRNAVIAYNTDAKWYIATNILPCYKYYFYQEWQSSKSPKMKQENEEFYQSLTAKWIVVGKYGVNDEIIQQVLTKNYGIESIVHIKEDNQEYDITLYHIKQ